MARARISPFPSTPLLVRVGKDTLRALDAGAKRERDEESGVALSRSAFVRKLIADGLRARKASRKKGPSSALVRAYVTGYRKVPEDIDWSLGRAAVETWAAWPE